MSDSKKNQLKKTLGLSFNIAVLIGGTIGVGILRTPGTIAEMLNNYWLILACWLFGGLYVLLGANSYSELATMLPKAGGSYNYIKRALGEYAGFLSGWYDYIVNAIPPAFYCIVISEYTIILFPELAPYSTVISISILVAFVLLHLSGVKNGSVIQQITSLLKVICFVALVVACFLYSGVNVPKIQTDNSIFQIGLIFGFFKSLQLIIGTYNGWNAVCFFAEENDDPSKNIPKSLYSGVLLVVAIYILVNAAFFHVLPIETLAKSNLAAADVAKILFGENGAKIVTVISIFSLISILNAFMMIPPRILYGLSRDGFFIQKGTIVNKGGTPIVALLVSSFFSLFLICIGSFEVLFSFAAFISIIVWGLAYYSLLKLRTSEPDLPRPYRSFWYPWTTIIAIIFSIALLAGFVYSDPKSFIIIVGIAIVSYPLFLVLKKKK
ncbi:APA family basic amino acid/polyamine antiporter [Flavobacterium nitrogenifigens]|uniref:APA family basic amino acid/polyamine antiporter n=2 Tax=Flavobacterium TaxID=237 RepID=A0A7W7IYU9_9FLAO|nr:MULTISPECIES: APC family permease [Flavobacterium]MBB4803047.1 APA family basic amino acid/polyamine antiporter [Flavobacterium nitrogenifigens]MBB6388005.1 APA family basic amino acid/polyamine antiporter [Flavobacterium notoginsengisoli]